MRVARRDRGTAVRRRRLIDDRRCAGSATASPMSSTRRPTAKSVRLPTESSSTAARLPDPPSVSSRGRASSGRSTARRWRCESRRSTPRITLPAVRRAAAARAYCRRDWASFRDGQFVALHPGAGRVVLRGDGLKGEVPIEVDATPARSKITPRSAERRSQHHHCVGARTRTMRTATCSRFRRSLRWSANAGSIDRSGHFHAGSHDANSRGSHRRDRRQRARDGRIARRRVAVCRTRAFRHGSSRRPGRPWRRMRAAGAASA